MLPCEDVLDDAGIFPRLVSLCTRRALSFQLLVGGFALHLAHPPLLSNT